MLVRRRVLGGRHAADATDDDRRADAGDRLLDDAGVDARHDDRRRCCSSASAGLVPDAVTLAAVGYNAVLIFGLAQPVWLILARSAAADRVEHVGDDDPGARHGLGALVAERAAALAGRRGDRPRPARDRLGDVADARRRRRRAPADVGTASAASRRLRRAYGSAKPSPTRISRLARLHALGVGGALVVEALRVQRAVDDEVRVVRDQRDALLARFALDAPARTGRGRRSSTGSSRRRRSARWWRGPAPRKSRFRARPSSPSTTRTVISAGAASAARIQRATSARASTRAVARVGELQREAQRRPGCGAARATSAQRPSRRPRHTPRRCARRADGGRRRPT